VRIAHQVVGPPATLPNFYRTPGDTTLRGCCLPGSQKGDKVVLGRRGLRHEGQRGQSTDCSGLAVGGVKIKRFNNR